MKITLTDEQFFINNKSGVTKQKELCDLFKESAKVLALLLEEIKVI